MHRRTVLAATAASGAVATAGCLSRLPGVGSSVETEFDLVDPPGDVADSPEVSVDGETLTARGTIQYGSSDCGTVDLAHAAYEDSQDRLDLLVVAADDSGVAGGCNDDLVETGYRLEATVDGGFRRASVTEHHVFGETYSTTVD